MSTASNVKSAKATERRVVAVAAVVLCLALLGLFVTKRQERKRMRDLQAAWNQEKAALLQRLDDHEKEALVASPAGRAGERHAFIASYFASLRELLHESETTTPQAFSLKFKAFVGHYVGDDGFWRELTAFVDASCHGLASRVRRDYPELVETDFRIIELTACRFNYVEIASLLGMNRNSITKKRTRIARKMGLEQTLTDYLDQLRST